MHPRNKNKDRYDLEKMAVAIPALRPLIVSAPDNRSTVDFSNPTAVKLLNRAILKHYYGIQYWEFPENHLCPAIPGRAEYIHNIADVLKKDHFGNVPKGNKIKCLDIGTGASCIFPIIGVTEYNWSFIGSETDIDSMNSAQNIIDKNSTLNGKIKLVVQKNPDSIFRNIINKTDKIDISICNPPFHANKEEALKGTLRKLKNLKKTPKDQPILNFAGQNSELIYPGGELNFITKMIKESKQYSKNIKWFTTLVSKETHLKKVIRYLKTLRPFEMEVIDFNTGNKKNRILVWTHLSDEQRENWPF